MKTLMHGKKGLIMGVANKRSLAWGIAQQLHKAGADIAFTYMDDALEKRVRPLAESLNSPLILPCDVSSDDSIAAVFKEIEKSWGKIDFIVHAIAFAHKEDLMGDLTSTNRANFAMAMDISAYSFIAIAKAAKPLLNEGASLLTLTYVGATSVVPNYNVMGVAKAALEASTRYLATEFGEKGVRVNALSAGPVKTLAASGIGDFKAMLRHHEQTAPLKRLTTQEDVGKAGLYLLSDLSSGVTGEIHFVDGGANTLGGTPVSEL